MPLSSLAILHGFLSEIRTGLRRRAGRLAVLGLALGVAALALLLPLLAVVVRPGPAASFAMLAAAGVLGALGLITAIVLGTISPGRRWQSDGAVARFVGTRRPPLASDLLSTVELATARSGPGAPSPALVGALTDATAAKLVGVDPAGLIDRTAVRRTGQALAGIAVLHVGLLALAPGSIVGGRTGTAVERSRRPRQA